MQPTEKSYLPLRKRTCGFFVSWPETCMGHQKDSWQANSLVAPVVLEWSPDMQEKSGNMIGGLRWFLTGLAAGLSLGILFAPQSGEKSRRLIRNKAQDGNDLLKSSVNQGQEYIKRQGKELLDEANDLIDRGKNAVKHQKDQLSAAIEAGKEAYRSYM